MNDTGPLLLRPTRAQDLDRVITLENDTENAPYIRQWSRQQHLSALDNPDISHQIVELTPDTDMVGYVIMIGCMDTDRSLQIKRIVIADKGRGYGRQAIKLVKAYAFDVVHCHRLWLEVVENYERAYHLYESEGFATEGVLREALKRGDHFVSLTVMSILEQDYRGS